MFHSVLWTSAQTFDRQTDSFSLYYFIFNNSIVISNDKKRKYWSKFAIPRIVPPRSYSAASQRFLKFDAVTECTH